MLVYFQTVTFHTDYIILNISIIFINFEVIDMKNTVVNWWNIIVKLKNDNSLWDYLEPAEMMEIVQRMKEAKEMITGLDKYITIDIRPALQKLNFY